MQLPVSPFQVIAWDSVPVTEHAGETGVAKWRTMLIGDVRVRQVEYSAGTSRITGAIADTFFSFSTASWSPSYGMGARSA